MNPFVLDRQFDFETELRIIERPRLADAFCWDGGVRVVVVLAPAGYGKSLAVRSHLRAPQWLHFRVGATASTFARFVRGFADALAPLAPGAAASFPRAWERALQFGSPETVLARWLCEHLQHLPVDLVIDDLHEAACDSSIAAFIAELVRLRGDRRLAIAARVGGLLPIPLWMATGIMNSPIDDNRLAFDPPEVHALATASGRKVDADAIATRLAGFPAAIAYTIVSDSIEPAVDEPAAATTRYAALAESLFANRTPRERQFLIAASLLPAIRPDLLAACGWSDWHAILSGMRHDAPFMWETVAPGAFRFHDRFADFLRVQRALEDPSLRVALGRQAVAALIAAREYGDALGTAVAERLGDDIHVLLNEHGFDILESGQVDAIGEALSLFDGSETAAGPVATAIRGYLEARLGRLDTAESWFALGLNSATNDESRVAIALYYAREIMHRLRDDAYAILEPFADLATLADESLIDVRSSLAQAYMLADRVSDARERMSQAMLMLRDGHPGTLRARVLARAAYVAVESGDAAAAREYALRAAPIAIAEGLYDVAASVYSVLYSIAYEIDDSPKMCHEYLTHVRDYGVKSGTLRLDLYVLVATYELDAEAGDRVRLAQADRTIGELDVKQATSSFLESFLPARAMQAGWNGDFGSAFAVLAPTPERQWTTVRRALRWSEVALHASAAGETSAAVAALAAARGCIDDETGQTTHFSFALLNCALACWVMSDDLGARTWLERARDPAISNGPRVRAFRDAVGSLVAGTIDPRVFGVTLPAALAALRQCGFGGIAMLIEALPCPRSLQPYRFPAATVGARITAVLLDARFAAAVESERDEAQLFAFLADHWDSDVAGRTIVPVVRHWPEPTQLRTQRSRRLAARIREFATARSHAPAIVGTFGGDDDADARIDLLFTDLKLTAPLMAEHSQAVSAWCARIARRLGLDEIEVSFVARCGLLHDIGKVVTPDSILNAPRKLDPREWEIMRDHAAQGARIAAAIPVLVPFVPVIRGHHERLDGKGYPDGLTAVDIPLATRIVTVADCFNAMIGRRSYRSPLAPTLALEELDRNRNTQFDPAVVDAMIHIVMGHPSAATDVSVPIDAFGLS